MDNVIISVAAIIPATAVCEPATAGIGSDERRSPTLQRNYIPRAISSALSPLFLSGRGRKEEEEEEEEEEEFT